METSTLFPRHFEKHKFLLRSIEGLALHGPLKYFEQSAAIKTLSNYITDHLELLLEHILNTDLNEMWQEKYDQSVELFSRMCKALESFVSLKHPQTCVKCKYD